MSILVCSTRILYNNKDVKYKSPPKSGTVQPAPVVWLHCCLNLKTKGALHMKLVFLDKKTIGEDIDFSPFRKLGDVVEYDFTLPE